MATGGGRDAQPAKAVFAFAGANNDLEIRSKANHSQRNGLQIRFDGHALTAVPVISYNSTAGELQVSIKPEATTASVVKSSLNGFSNGNFNSNYEVASANSEGEGGVIGAITKTASPFNLRLILHVDNQNKVHLLKEAIQAWRDGQLKTVMTDVIGANGQVQIPLQTIDRDNPGKFVILTGPDAFASLALRGVALRDGQPVARRVSSVGYDFEGRRLAFDIGFDTFAPGKTLKVNWTLAAQHPANPFLHRYHPDHDMQEHNGVAPDLYNIQREMTLSIDAQPSADARSINYAYDVLTGNYLETLSGLHSDPLYVAGRFTLNRIAFTDELVESQPKLVPNDSFPTLSESFVETLCRSPVENGLFRQSFLTKTLRHGLWGRFQVTHASLCHS